MKAIKLKVSERKNEDLSDLRTEKKIPAIMYGKWIESTKLTLKYTDFLRVFRESGQSHTIELDINGEKTVALVHDVQYHPVSGDFVHVDFLIINKNEPINASVQINLENKAPAEALWAIINQTMSSIEIKCLPKYLVDSFTVDISCLKEYWDSIHLKDMNIPEWIEILHAEPEVTIVTAQAPRVASTSNEEDTPTEEDTPSEWKEAESEEKSK